MTASARNAHIGEIFRGQPIGHTCANHTNGRGACLTHDFITPMRAARRGEEINSHVDEAEQTGEVCVLLWWCFDHGPEITQTPPRRP